MRRDAHGRVKACACGRASIGVVFGSEVCRAHGDAIARATPADLGVTVGLKFWFLASAVRQFCSPVTP